MTTNRLGFMNSKLAAADMFKVSPAHHDKEAGHEQPPEVEAKAPVQLAPEQAEQPTVQYTAFANANNPLLAAQVQGMPAFNETYKTWLQKNDKTQLRRTSNGVDQAASELAGAWGMSQFWRKLTGLSS